MPPPGQGWLTGASSTSPETRSAWSSARFRASAPAPGMADDDHALDADFPERRADDPRLRRRRGRLGAADAVAPAAARTVDGDDPEAPRQPLAERRHGIARGAGGAVQEKHGRLGLAPLRRHLDDVQAPARDLNEAAGRRIARLDDAGDDRVATALHSNSSTIPASTTARSFIAGGRDQMSRPSISGVRRSIASRSFAR